MVQTTQYYKLCRAVTSVKPLKLARVMNVFHFFAVAHRLCYEVKVRTLCTMFCKGYSLQGTRERIKTQKRCFGATEPLDENNSVKLLRLLCDVISALRDPEARS